MAAPTFVAVGALGSSGNAITLGQPASPQVNDIWIMVVQTSNQAMSTPTNATSGTWAEVAAQTGTGTAATAGAVRLCVFWHRWTTTTGNITVPDSGDHQIARIAAYRGCIATGNPWDVTSAPMTTGTYAGSTVLFPRITTTVAETRVIACVAHSEDIADADRISENFTGSDLTDTGQRFSNTLSTGTGGGIGIFDGALAAAGLIDTSGADTSFNCTFVINPTNYVLLTLALKSTATIVLPELITEPLTPARW